MSLLISNELLQRIHIHGQAAYPEEGAGLMLGSAQAEDKTVQRLLEFANAREQSARHNRYLLTAEDVLHGEMEAARLGMDVIGVFHSHPDPNTVRFDRDGRRSVYVITSVVRKRSRAVVPLRIASFTEETIIVLRRFSAKSENLFVRSRGFADNNTRLLF
jgi:proteasome lid subunit RPN8/RPN11